MAIKSAIIICIGDELLIGQTIDTNSAWMAQQLNALGISITRKYTINDDEFEIFKALNESIAEADLVLITGGLGPTKDDITKATLVKYFNTKLIRNFTVYEHITNFFKVRNRPMLPVNDLQADVPENCTILFNRLGTAPGMLFEKSNTWIVSMPGVPREMKSIVEEELIPRLKAQQTNEQFIIHKTLLTFGRGESFVAEDIHDIESALPDYMKLAYLPNHGELRLRLTVTGSDFIKLKNEITVYFQLIYDRLVEYVVAVEDIKMEAAIVQLLLDNRLTVSTAESCTGGLIANKITDIPGASAVYLGSVIAYDNLIKVKELAVKENTLEKYGAVSAATVAQMAESVRVKMETDWSVAVSGILGPTGGSPEKPVGLVFFAVASKNTTKTFSFNFAYDRAINKEMVAKTALNLLRKEIQTSLIQ